MKETGAPYFVFFFIFHLVFRFPLARKDGYLPVTFPGGGSGGPAYHLPPRAFSSQIRNPQFSISNALLPVRSMIPDSKRRFQKKERSERRGAERRSERSPA